MNIRTPDTGAASAPVQVSSGAVIYGRMYYGGGWVHPARAEKPGLYVYSVLWRDYEDSGILGVYATMDLAQAAVWAAARERTSDSYPRTIEDDGDGGKRIDWGNDYHIARHRIEVGEIDKEPA